MNKSNFNKAILLISFLMSVSVLSYSQSNQSRPNIVLFLLDDAGWGDFSSTGNPWIKTPNIDKIKDEGLYFDRFYVSPLCAPTRASLLTGRYHLRTGTAAVTSGLETMRTEEVTFAEIFRDAGYNTGIFGKWHNGAHFPENPLGQGFNEFLGFCAGHWSNYFDPKLQHNNTMIRTEGYITDVLTDAALKFIETNKSTPFFCYIPYNAPHSPFQVPDKYFNRFDKTDLPVTVKSIYGMIENVDDNIARVIQKLDELKLTDNTIVIFMSDNGPIPVKPVNRYNGDMKGVKGQVDEGGVRVPFYMKWPKHIQKGLKIEKMGAHIDVLPTLAELANVELPENLFLDGQSLVPLINSQSSDWPEREIFTHVYLRNRGLMSHPGTLRSARYRYVVDKSGDELLYDMLSDPQQKKNIAAENPKIMESFRNEYNSWFKDVSVEGISKEITQVGYKAAPVVELFAPDVSYKKGVVFAFKNGFAHDWLVGWNKPNDIAEWTIEAVDDGEYRIRLKYNCGEGFKGKVISATVDGQQLNVVVNKSYVGKVIEGHDRIGGLPAPEKDWGILNMGDVTLQKGIHKIKIETDGKANDQENFELKSVFIQKL